MARSNRNVPVGATLLKRAVGSDLRRYVTFAEVPHVPRV